MEGLTVAVLGGSGFLGQHVVAQLLAADPAVREVRVLDVRPFQPSVELPAGASASVVYKECDVRDTAQLREGLAGAQAVINCAGISPDFRKEDLGYGPHMTEVHLDGVRKLVEACRTAGVRALVHTSSVSVVMGGARLLEHTETLSPRVAEEDLVLGKYAVEKLRGEQVVLAAHGSNTHTGETLRTVALRPPLLYGEGDKFFMPLMMALARAGGNKLPSLGNPAAFLQAAYAGNIAAAHVCALKKLLSGADEGLQGCGGLPAYVTDETPPHNLAGLALPFLQQFHIQPPVNLYYWVVSLMLLLGTLCGFVWSVLGVGVSSTASTRPSRVLHRFSGTVTVVSRMRAELCTGYSPPYSWSEAQRRSSDYYAKSLQ